MSEIPKIIENLYLRYGFNAEKSPSKEIKVFTFSHGYFFNAEIVCLKQSELTESVKKDLENTGYSTRVLEYKSKDQIEAALFDGFFKTDQTKARLESLYEDFCKKQSQLLGSPYQFVETSFCEEQISNEQVEQSLPQEQDRPIIEYLGELFKTQGPLLVFLEAGAGFGKTTTAFEFLRWILDKDERLPVFTELSKNRQARIFKYVLLDEIDRCFNLKSKLVIEEVKAGKLPLIIDGFDEILAKRSIEEGEESFEDAEPMLDTIAELLGENAKILITTRRSALLSGDEFHDWVASNDRDFKVTRLILNAPSVRDWLGYEKTESLERSGFPIWDFKNPVLLSYLRTISEDKFTNLSNNPHQIMDHYFQSILERERDRQDLRLTVSQQMKIFENLAHSMLTSDYYSESRDFFALVIADYLENKKILNEALLSYTGKDKIEFNELVGKLLVHALLDRSGQSDRIMFINELVLGVFFGNIISKSAQNDWIGSEKQAEIATSAYSILDESKRETLWRAMEEFRLLTDPQTRFEIDLKLKREPVGDFQDGTFEGLVLSNTPFCNASFADCVFIDCNFTNINFDFSRFRACGFLSCNFFDCSLDQSKDNTNWFEACNDNNSFISKIENLSHVIEAGEANRELANYERAVLERFWPPGRASAVAHRKLRTLCLGPKGQEREQIEHAIRSLAKKGIISIETRFASLDFSYISEIKKILGRD